MCSDNLFGQLGFNIFCNAIICVFPALVSSKDHGEESIPLEEQILSKSMHINKIFIKKHLFVSSLDYLDHAHIVQVK